MLEIVTRQMQALAPGGLDLPSPEVLQRIVLAIGFFAVIIATTVHEFGHAWMADRLGDPTPREHKRVSLAPWRHLDLLGTLLLIATMITGFPLGWGRPVRTDPDKYRCGKRAGVGLVAAAGPLMNLLTAVVLSPLVRYFFNGGYVRSIWEFWAFIVVAIVVLVNISLFSFNLVPIAPLDGAHVTASLLPEDLSRPYRRFMVHYGGYLLFALTITGKLGEWIQPVVVFLFQMLTGIVIG